jgi:hypothetical protein
LHEFFSPIYNGHGRLGMRDVESLKIVNIRYVSSIIIESKLASIFHQFLRTLKFKVLTYEHTNETFIGSVRRLLVTTSFVPRLPILVTLMKEALSSLETSVLTRATRRIITEDVIIQLTTCFKLLAHIIY